jgi:hypothetical protein
VRFDPCFAAMLYRVLTYLGPGKRWGLLKKGRELDSCRSSRK